MFEREDEQHVDQVLVVQELRKGVREGKRKADGGLDGGVIRKETSFHEQACELVDFVRGNGPSRRGRRGSPNQHLLSSLTPLITFAIEHVESEEEIQCASADQQFIRQHQTHDRRRSVDSTASDRSNEVRAATKPVESSDGAAEGDMQFAIEAGTMENATKTTDALDESNAELHGSRSNQASPTTTPAHQVSRERPNHTITSAITATTTRRGEALEKYNTGFEAALLFAAGFDASTLSDDEEGEDFVAGFCAGSGVVGSAKEG
ncbi:hypothetical protein LTR66_001626 [Elasticomyces elasticus]|nr:hypothetical protein LTR66_001626 [Elasticomyces elasticus]